MSRKSLLPLTLLAVIVLFPGAGFAQDASVISAIQQPSAESLMPETDQCIGEKEPMTLEKLKSIFGAHKVCNVACYAGPPWVDCTAACGMSASCYDGYCLYM